MSAAEKLEPTGIVAPGRGDLMYAEHKYRTHALTVSDRIDPKKDLENPALWVNVSSKLRIMDEVRVINLSETWLARVIITFINGTDVRAKVLEGFSLEGGDEIEMDAGAFDVKLCGQLKWCVIRLSDGERVKERMPTKLEAEKWLVDYQKALSN